MKLSDFDFDLPERLIATRPARPRSASRLLVVDKAGLSDRQFAELPDILHPGDRLVLNDTKVIPARLFGLRHRDSQQGAVTARIEVLLLTPEADGHVWQAMVKPLKKFQVGERIEFDPDFGARLLEKSDDGTARLEFDCAGEAFDAALARAGQMPLPPYIASKRAADERDREDYQTIWAAEKGAIAAPTASLHFDAAVMDALAARGVEVSHVTLHVGAGTFLPVKVEDISRHKMHSEWGRIPAKAAGEINATRAAGGRIIAVGTTALRLIESAADDNGHLSAWTGETDIFIRPGHRFKITDGLITNFHLPKSSLLMLVSALMGLERMQAAYRHAIAHGYRFFSYGDASLLLPDDEVADNAAGPA